MKPNDPQLPAQLRAAQRRFEEWRSTRTRHCRIPPVLWRAAVSCAMKYGLYPTVCALGLDYTCLKRRVQTAGGSAVIAKRSPAFVELVAPRSGLPECMVELENRRGVKLRLELRGSAVPDLVQLARSFASEET